MCGPGPSGWYTDDENMPMQNPVRICGFLLLLLVLSVGEGVRGQDRFEVNEKRQWERWTFPAGTLELRADGSVKPMKFAPTVNAASNAGQFSHETKKQGTVQGGIWDVGSNSRDAGNIIDGKTGPPYWKPDPADPLEDWWIQIDLGRIVAANKIRLHFPAEDGARPLGLFRVLGSDGRRWAISDDFFFFDLIGGASRLNEETLIEYQVTSSGKATVFRLVDPSAGSSADTSAAFAALQYIRIVVDDKTPDAALSEVEVFTYGENIAPGTYDRGGLIDVPGGLPKKLIDEDLNTVFTGSAKERTSKFRLTWDLGALFWIGRIIELAPGPGGSLTPAGWSKYGHELTQLLVSDGSRLSLSREVEYDLVVDFPDPVGWNRPVWLTYLFLPPRPVRYIRHFYPIQQVNYASESTTLNDIAVFPVGHVARVEMTAFVDLERRKFVDLGEQGRLDRRRAPKVIRSLNWEANVPDGSRVQARTRSGNTLVQDTLYFNNKNEQLEEPGAKELYFRLPEKRRGEKTPVLAEGEGWSEWSNPYQFSGQPFLSPSPRRYVQFEVILISDRPEAAPTLRSLSLDFADALLAEAVGEIEPKAAQAGVAQSFSYGLRPRSESGDTGFDRIKLTTPSQASADRFSIAIGGNPVELDAQALQFFPYSLVVDLPRVVRREEVEIEVHVRVVETPYHFDAFVGSTQNPGLWQPVDPDPEVRFATTVFLPVPETDRLITNLSVQPVLTPNGDGVGDQAEIRFAVLNVSVPATVRIHGLAGRLVRELDGKRGPDGFWLYTWPGDDEAGSLVPAGIYLCRIDLETQASEETVARTIGVVY